MVPLYCSWIQFLQNKEPRESLYLQYTQVRLRPSVRPSQLLKLYEKEFVTETFKNTVIPRLKKVIRSGITFVSRNVISRRFL